MVTASSTPCVQTALVVGLQQRVAIVLPSCKPHSDLALPFSHLHKEGCVCGEVPDLEELVFKLRVDCLALVGRPATDRKSTGGAERTWLLLGQKHDKKFFGLLSKGLSH